MFKTLFILSLAAFSSAGFTNQENWHVLTCKIKLNEKKHIVTNKPHATIKDPKAFYKKNHRNTSSTSVDPLATNKPHARIKAPKAFYKKNHRNTSSTSVDPPFELNIVGLQEVLDNIHDIIREYCPQIINLIDSMREKTMTVGFNNWQEKEIILSAISSIKLSLAETMKAADSWATLGEFGGGERLAAAIALCGTLERAERVFNGLSRVPGLTEDLATATAVTSNLRGCLKPVFSKKEQLQRDVNAYNANNDAQIFPNNF